jgi:very-short-patch-repair endonuclease
MTELNPPGLPATLFGGGMSFSKGNAESQGIFRAKCGTSIKVQMNSCNINDEAKVKTNFSSKGENFKKARNVYRTQPPNLLLLKFKRRGCHAGRRDGLPDILFACPSVRLVGRGNEFFSMSSMNKKLKQISVQTARDLRKRETPSEKLLWSNLRNRQLHGVRFLRQHPIMLEWLGKDAFFIADFYCPKHRIVIEVDGGIHELQKEYDQFRSMLIQNRKMRIVRFSNDEIQSGLEVVLRKLTLLIMETNPK